MYIYNFFIEKRPGSAKIIKNNNISIVDLKI